MKNSAPMPRRPLCQFISAVHAACIMSSETQKATGKSSEGMLGIPRERSEILICDVGT